MLNCPRVMRQCCDRELRGNSQDNELYYLDTIKSYKPINNLRSGFFLKCCSSKREGKKKRIAWSQFTSVFWPSCHSPPRRGGHYLIWELFRYVWPKGYGLRTLALIWVYRYLSHFFVIIEEKINKSALQFGFTVIIVSSTNYPVIRHWFEHSQ